jgi:hypothetical protein
MVLTKRGQPFEQPTKNGLLTAEDRAIRSGGGQRIAAAVGYKNP